METEYDPSQPEGILWRRDWKLAGDYKITLHGTFRGKIPVAPEGDSAGWKMYQPGYGFFGIAIGGKNIFEGYGKARNTTIFGWKDDAKRAVVAAPKGKSKKAAAKPIDAPDLAAGDTFTLSFEVKGNVATSTFKAQAKSVTLVENGLSEKRTDGYFEIAGRGLTDFEFNGVGTDAGKNAQLKIGVADCCACYPLGDTLQKRAGVVTVYGDVHNGSIIKNKEHRLIECSFGPIGRSGGRAVIPGFGPSMKDFDGRELDVFALYHKEHATPDLKGHAKGDPFYWNFLEMEFDPSKPDPAIGMRIRNMIDAPDEKPRGGGALKEVASQSGRPPTCKLPAINTLLHADVRFVHTDGSPIRGTQTRADGVVPLSGLSWLISRA